MDTPEGLKDIPKDPAVRDDLLMKVAEHYIGQPGVDTEELVRMTAVVPFVNGLRIDIAERTMDRIHTANDILPQAKVFVGDYFKAVGFDGSGGEETLKIVREFAAEGMDFATISVNAMHVLLPKVKEKADETNLPLRELQAALARIGVETCVNMLLNSKDLQIRKLAKLHLLYFSDIEMLSVGVKTNSYQFSFVDPSNVRPELLTQTDRIVPMIDASKDDKLKGALAFGQVEVSKVVPSGVPGIDFLHLT